jgi:hypothetical protein
VIVERVHYEGRDSSAGPLRCASTLFQYAAPLSSFSVPLCPKSKLPVVDPVQCSGGHISCRQCADYISGRCTEAQCDEAATHSAALFIRQHLDALSIICMDCGCTMARRELMDHRARACALECRFLCGVKVTPLQAEAHEAHCPKRAVEEGGSKGQEQEQAAHPAASSPQTHFTLELFEGKLAGFTAHMNEQHATTGRRFDELAAQLQQLEQQRCTVVDDKKDAEIARLHSALADSDAERQRALDAVLELMNRLEQRALEDKPRQEEATEATKAAIDALTAKLEQQIHEGKQQRAAAEAGAAEASKRAEQFKATVAQLHEELALLKGQQYEEASTANRLNVKAQEEEVVAGMVTLSIIYPYRNGALSRRATQVTVSVTHPLLFMLAQLPGSLEAEQVLFYSGSLPSWEMLLDLRDTPEQLGLKNDDTISIHLCQSHRQAGGQSVAAAAAAAPEQANAQGTQAETVAIVVFYMCPYKGFSSSRLSMFIDQPLKAICDELDGKVDVCTSFKYTHLTRHESREVDPQRTFKQLRVRNGHQIWLRVKDN